MTDRTLLSRRFEARRPRLRALALRLLGSAMDTDDVLQETWLRLERTDSRDIENLDAWLTTVTSRLCLDLLRSPRRTRERTWHVEEWADEPDDRSTEPAAEATLNDTVTVALLVVLDTLNPTERLALVLHDVFGLSFAEIGDVLDKTPEATRQIASRARRRIRTQPRARTHEDPHRSRAVITAWLEAVQDGDFEALLEILDEGAVLHADYGTTTQTIRGARAIAENAAFAADLAANSRLVWIGGRPGVAAVIHGNVVSLMAFDIDDDRITGLDVLADPAHLMTLGVAEKLSERSALGPDEM